MSPPRMLSKPTIMLKQHKVLVGLIVLVPLCLVLNILYDGVAVATTVANPIEWTEEATFNTKNDHNNNTEETGGPPFLHHSNKTLVLLIGGLRGGEVTWATIHKHVLDKNYADLALMMDATNNVSSSSSSLLNRAKYIWTAPERYTDWADAMEVIPNKPQDWRNRLFSNTTHPNFIALGGASHHKHRGSGAIIFMLRYFARQHIQDLDLHHRYERFIISRSDQYFVCPHDISKLDPSKIWVPNGQDFRGICDRHAVIPAKYVLEALDILSPIVQHTERYVHVFRNKPMNTEQLVELRWTEENLIPEHVSRFKRNMFLAADSINQKGWKKIDKNQIKQTNRFGVYFKYPLENIVPPKQRVANIFENSRNANDWRSRHGTHDSFII